MSAGCTLAEGFITDGLRNAIQDLVGVARGVVRLGDPEIVAIAAFRPLQSLIELVLIVAIEAVPVRALQVLLEQVGDFNYA
jgi:hypothetical protein